jgi:O-antigen ligase
MPLLLPMVAALSAILIFPGWSFFFDVVPKVAIILVGAAFVFLLPREWPADTWKGPAAKPLRYFAAIAGAQAIVILLSTVFSTHRQLSWIGSTWRRSGAIAEIAVLVLAVAFAGQLAADRHRLRKFLRITVLASIPISIYGILQYFGIDPLLAAAGYHFGEGRFMIVRPPSTLGHASYFATYLLFAAFGGAALVMEETASGIENAASPKTNAVGVWFAAIAASVLAIFGIVLSGTRAALLGFLIGAAFVVVRNRLDSGRAFRLPVRPSVRFLAPMGVLALLAGFYFSNAGERLRARAFWASEDRLGGSRLLLWRDSLHMSADHLLTGYGPETFAVEFPMHQSLDLARAFPDFYHESPHNIFLDALVSKGIFGLAGLGAMVLLCLAYVRGPMGGAFVAMLVSQQFTTFTLPTELYFYLCAAVLVSGVTPVRAAVVPASRRWQAIFAIPFIAMAVYLTVGDTLLATARRALDRGDFDRAAEFEDRARRWNASSDIYFSRRYAAPAARKDPSARFRAWQYALAAARQAPEDAEDRQNALLNLAALQATSDDAGLVERTLRDAVAAAPVYFKSHWLLAQVLELEGRIPEARAEAEAAFDRDGGKHPEVTALRDRLGGRTERAP